jgi:hypothetical protein
MEREEFIGVLEEEGYSYEIEGDKLVVTHDSDVDLGPLETIPSGVVFKNRGWVYLGFLKTIPYGVEFRNEGYVNLYSLQAIHPDVEFSNDNGIYLSSLIGGWFNEWEDNNIEGINNKRLLNLMISKGLFI